MANAEEARARIALAQGRLDEARRCVHDVLELHRRMGLLPDALRALDTASHCLVALGAAGTGLRLLAATASRRDAAGISSSGCERHRWEETYELALQALRGKEVDAALADGAGLSVSAAVDLAQQVLGSAWQVQ
jgi:hypothetical protein